MTVKIFEFHSAVLDYHDFQKYWELVANQQLDRIHEVDNHYDYFEIKICTRGGMAVRQDIRPWKFHGLQNIFCNGVQRLQQRLYPVIIEYYPWFKAVQKFNAVLQLLCKNKIRKSYKSIKILQRACTLSQMEVQLLVCLCIILLTYRQIIERAKVTKHQRNLQLVLEKHKKPKSKIFEPSSYSQVRLNPTGKLLQKNLKLLKQIRFIKILYFFKLF